MKIWLVVISLGLIVFLAGCVKEKPTEVQFKNDIVTIENMVITNLAPYEEGTTTVEFDVKNNGDRPIDKVTVNFFDVPGFAITGLECSLDKIDLKSHGPYCEFFTDSTEGKIEPLDSRHIILGLKAAAVDSPTPFTISFSVNYQCLFGDKTSAVDVSKSCIGTREVVIPIIDGVIKKEPSFKFSQSEPNFGPIVINIQPLLERQKSVDGKTIKEYWGTVGQSFPTKFVLQHVGTLKDKIKPVNIAAENLKITELTRLIATEKSGTVHKLIGSCDFRLLSGKECVSKEGEPFPTPHYSCKPINETFNTLICTFKPDSAGAFEPEFTSTIKIQYAYTYEFIRSVNFVVYPKK